MTLEDKLDWLARNGSYSLSWRDWRGEQQWSIVWTPCKNHSHHQYGTSREDAIDNMFGDIKFMLYEKCDENF